ncbi:DUF6437 family protein [Novosphingopyxis sp.]|uniref:DUF6437 family protein n=1 Tax=Novosphingopyxis sp. TaxID=2709690 RepID=UPI003B593AE3
MPSTKSAILALKKLEVEREALARRQHELEEKAALELGRIILGTGIENFSRGGLKRVATALGKLGETAAIAKFGSTTIAS